MKLKNLFILSLGLLATAACMKEEAQEPTESVFYSQMEDFTPDVKTGLGEMNSVVWKNDDCISIFAGNSLGKRYRVSDQCIGTPNGKFIPEAEDDDYFHSGNELGSNVAVYPYSSEYICYGSWLNEYPYTFMVSDVTFKDMQTYSPGSFPDESFVMMAVTDNAEDKHLKFKNLCGVLKISLYGSGRVKRLTLSGNAGECLAGKANIYGGYELYPSYEIVEEAGTSVTLDCGAGVDLDADEPTDFMMAVPPVYFENGFTVVVEDTEGGSQSLTATVANEILRSQILVMPPKEVSLSSPKMATIAEACQTSETVIITGTVKAVSSRAVLVSDGTANILVYYGPDYGEIYSIGDVLNIRGRAQTYYYAYEFLPEETYYSHTEEAVYEEAAVVDSEYLDNALATLTMYGGTEAVIESRYVELEGAFINPDFFKVKGCNEIVSIYPLNSTHAAMRESILYKNIRIKGYTFYLSNSEYLTIVPAAIEVLTDEEATADDALGEQKYSVTGTVKATCSRGYVLENENSSTFVYCGKYYTGNYVIGDNVTATGMLRAFQHGTELYWVYDVHNGKDENITFGTPEILTAEALDSYIASTIGNLPYENAVIPTKYIQLTGTLMLEGRDYNIIIDGAEHKTNLFLPDNGNIETMTPLIGEKVVFNGYMLKVTESGNLSLMPTSLEKYQEEENI